MDRDKIVEEKFVDDFIIRSMRTRIKYELSKKEKHWFVIRKLCPDTLDAFIQKYIVFKDRKVQYADVLKIMSRYVDVKSNVYYMHMDGGQLYGIHGCNERVYGRVVSICCYMQ